MRVPCRVRGISLAFVLLLGPAARAASAGEPQHGGGGANVHTLRFIVETPAGALHVDRDPEDPAVGGPPGIARVRLEGDILSFRPAVPGLPDLPYYTKLAVLPPGARVLSVRAIPRASLSIDDVPLIAWTQPAWPGQTGPPGGPPDPYHPPAPAVGPHSDYLERPRWPEALVEVDPSSYAGATLLGVRVSPVEWRPGERRLILHTSMEVEVRYRGGQPLQPRNYADAEMLAGLRRMVVDPAALPPARPLPPRRITDAPYLIITDNHRWIPNNFLPGIFVGDMVGEFDRLAAWKTQKGLKAAVVTISDIASGVYGDFRADDTRDVPEMIRKFLKFARRSWNTYWVLLGGDPKILPVRSVVGIAGGASDWFFARTGSEKPGVNECRWDGSRMRVHQNPKTMSITPDRSFMTVGNGALFEYSSFPSENNPGWAYATSDSYDTESQAPTEWIVVGGPGALLEKTYVYSDAFENTIPTDAYYSSLTPSFLVQFPNPPPLHDWDANDNGVYGQYSETGDLDGVGYVQDLAVGRAPVNDPDEARQFVDKVLAYEKYQDKPAGFGRSVLLGSSNWGGRPEVTEQGQQNPTNPPPDGTYWRAEFGVAYVLNFAAPPVPDSFNWRLFKDSELVPYSATPVPNQLSYFFCTDSTCTKPSEFTFLYLTIPIPTRYVSVTSPPTPQIHPQSFFFDFVAVDGSAVEKEQVKGLLEAKAPTLNQRLRLYEEFASLPPASDLRLNTISSMTFALQTGYNVVSLSGHGFPGGCCRVDSSLLPYYGLASENGFVYAESCSTNLFDGEAISEQLVRGPNGATAYLGNSRFSWIGHGAELERAFWSALDLDSRIGWLHGTRGLLTQAPAKRWAFFSLNLEGDPEMGLWLDEPIPPLITGDPSPDGGPGGTIQVTTPSGLPVAGARVAVRSARGLLEVQDTGSDGRARLRVVARRGERVTLTVSGAGLAPQERVFTIPDR